MYKRQFFAYVCEPERDDMDLLDEDALRAANPSYGVTVHRPFFADQATKKTQAVFRRYFHNVWTRGEEIWEVADLWKGLADPSIEPERERPTFVMVDLALRRDSAAVVHAQEVTVDGVVRVVLRCKIWANPYPADHALYASWHLNEVEVENYLRDLYRAFPKATIAIDGALRPGPAFFYDPMFMERTAQLLDGDGLAMVEWAQDDSKMVPAAQTFFELAKKGTLVHDGDPAFARQIANVTPIEKQKGWRIAKPKGSVRHIDAAIAAAVAAYHATTTKPPPPPTRVLHAFV